MDNKLKTFAALCAACISMVSTQPICVEDWQCDKGFYCEKEAAYCRRCLDCEELKREAPHPHIACVKSVVMCGVCFEGLVRDMRQDQRACVAPTALPDAAAAGLPAYVWVLIALAALVILLIVLVMFVVLRRGGNVMHILKICATTSVSPRNPEAPSAPAQEPPPDYNDVVHMDERAASPDPARNHADYMEEDSLRPFIKREPGAGAEGARSAARLQEAQPYNNPAYIRGASNIPNEDTAPVSPFPPPDDETLESHWTPDEPSNNNTITNTDSAVDEGAGATALALVPAAGTVRTRRGDGDAGPPPKTMCIRQDSTGSEDANHATEAGAGGGSVLVVINNFTNVNLPR